ncbi:hypothetical protein BU26DRAFT_120152 [Trematosphaeria pertusa]|uniref:Uncharacterized protein n=1 Tax=Trematosphaeria pertusa TaxID=390896 RepID=A0A6A6HXU8_9PLEO|nr:uncharacterized protein BU26DRAFT_120152 [Trematosphaeria pertusa]KAF2242861.1 hypothetical protein BU26DRAFT_120152 [Trematosphaeria pertusa]
MTSIKAIPSIYKPSALTSSRSFAESGDPHGAFPLRRRARKLGSMLLRAPRMRCIPRAPKFKELANGSCQSRHGRTQSGIARCGTASFPSSEAPSDERNNSTRQPTLTPPQLATTLGPRDQPPTPRRPKARCPHARRPRFCCAEPHLQLHHASPRVRLA